MSTCATAQAFALSNGLVEPLRLSFVAVQGDKLLDLLNRANDAALGLSETEESGVAVTGATYVAVPTLESAMDHLRAAHKARQGLPLAHGVVSCLFTLASSSRFDCSVAFLSTLNQRYFFLRMQCLRYTSLRSVVFI